MKESDIFFPVRDYFTNLGYKVQAEVKGCDVVAVKDEEIVAVELKQSFNLKVVFQAMERQKITPWVYVAIPRPKRIDRNFYKIKNLLTRLNLGLILVVVDIPDVSIILEPTDGKMSVRKRHKAVLLEASERNLPNIGGINRKKINTAFRERCIKIACIIEKIGQVTPKMLVSNYSCKKDASNILYKNHYGWFKRIGRGLYTLSDKGLNALTDSDYSVIVNFYRDVVNNI